MNQDDDRLLAMKAKLFGVTVNRRIRAGGGFKPDPADLSAPLEWKFGVIRGFCSGCGLIFEVNRSNLAELALRGKLKLPVDLEGFYLLADGCEVCDGSGDSIALVPIYEEAMNAKS